MSTPTNQKVAALLHRMSSVLSLTGANPFRVAAYDRAARALEDLSDDVAHIATTDQLTKIEGIGKGLAQLIVEYVETGRIAEIDEAVAKIPPGVLSMLEISGLGPKSVATLWRDGGVTTIEELKKKIASGELESLPRMGAKTLAKIAKAIEFSQSSSGRVRIGDALPLAESFVEQLRALKLVLRAGYAGSLRRARETIGDIDLLASCKNPEEQSAVIRKAFEQFPGVTEVIASGKTKSSVRTEAGLQVDLRVIDDTRYGAALAYFTGSKDHNIALRERAIKKKMSLNEYGLWKEGADPESSQPLAAATEEEIHEALGLRYIPPEIREGRGEIQASESNQLPRLIEVADIRAELHAHTVASDGSWSIEELAHAAKSRGFHTVAVTDHSVSQPIANGLDAKRLTKHIEAIREANKKMRGITILAGSEVDILADGRLDYPDELLAELDIVVASPHAALTQDPPTSTRRLIRAIENPYVHIIGHPTGRLIGRREGLSPDMAEVIRAAAATGTALEINSNPWRLDLRDTHARAAVEAGVLLAIDTDAHGPGDMDLLRYGVHTARRAWVEPRHVINTFSAAELKKWLIKKRQN